MLDLNSWVIIFQHINTQSLNTYKDESQNVTVSQDKN